MSRDIHDYSSHQWVSRSSLRDATMDAEQIFASHCEQMAREQGLDVVPGSFTFTYHDKDSDPMGVVGQPPPQPDLWASGKYVLVVTHCKVRKRGRTSARDDAEVLANFLAAQAVWQDVCNHPEQHAPPAKVLARRRYVEASGAYVAKLKERGRDIPEGLEYTTERLRKGDPPLPTE